jgi:branched-chain amino acid transport system permease protein
MQSSHSLDPIIDAPPLSLPASKRPILWRLSPHVTALTLAAGTILAALVADDYWYNAILIPWLVLSLAGLGLNILTGYAGQLSLGSAAFMAVGAFAAYNFHTRLPGLPLLGSIVMGGVTAACVGVVFGLPSLRVRGFYLIASTLAAQFFVQWALTKFSWFSGNNPSGVISAPPLVVLGRDFSSPLGRFSLTSLIVIASVLLVNNLVRSPLGRKLDGHP